MLQGFKQFVMRGNLVELAVAFVIGAAFSAVLTAFVDVIMSLIGLLLGGPPNFDQVAIGELVVGPFVTAVVTFLLIAAVVYFFVVLPYNKIQERRAQGDEPTPPSEEVTLLTQIRDLLSEQTTRERP